MLKDFAGANESSVERMESEERYNNIKPMFKKKDTII